jgi:hypothetical protein
MVELKVRHEKNPEGAAAEAIKCLKQAVIDIDARVSSEIHSRARGGFAAYAAGINQALSSDREYLVGDNLTQGTGGSPL